MLKQNVKRHGLNETEQKEKQIFNNAISLLRNEKLRLINGINVLKSDTLSLGKLNRAYTDSLLFKQNEITNLSSLANHFDSLSRANKDAADMYQAEAKSAEKSVGNWIVISIALISGFLIISILLSEIIKKQIRRNKDLQFEKSESEKAILTLNIEAARIAKENKENNYKLKLERSNAEMKLLSTLAINHDLDKFIPLFTSVYKRH